MKSEFNLETRNGQAPSQSDFESLVESALKSRGVLPCNTRVDGREGFGFPKIKAYEDASHSQGGIVINYFDRQIPGRNGTYRARLTYVGASEDVVKKVEGAVRPWKFEE